MTIACPHCGSRDVRTSLPRNMWERIGKALGRMMLRCRDCDKRFSYTIWDLRNAVYARCPRCYRLDLSMWDTSHYHAPTRWLIMMRLGAKPRRCEACRTNFVSFRPAKMKYSRTQKTARA